MLDIVETFRKGRVEIDPEDNAKLDFWDKVIYEKCENCGKHAEMDIVTFGLGTSVLEFACGCTKRCEVTWSTSNKQSS